jgi:hypothetical protein
MYQIQMDVTRPDGERIATARNLSPSCTENLAIHAFANELAVRSEDIQKATLVQLGVRGREFFTSKTLASFDRDGL